MSKRYIPFAKINAARAAKSKSAAPAAAKPAKSPARVSRIAGKPPLAFIILTATEDVQAKLNSNQKPYSLVHGTMKNGNKVTVQTYVKSGIEALTGLKAGETRQLSGTWTNGKVGDTRIRTFAAMGTYQTKAQKAQVAAPAAPVAAPAAEVAPAAVAA